MRSTITRAGRGAATGARRAPVGLARCQAGDATGRGPAGHGGRSRLAAGRPGESPSELGVESMRLAHEDEFSDAFPDCEVGAEPPFGNPYDVPVYVDRRLLEAPKLVCRAGSHTATLVLDTTE
ncbi:MAG TPA: YbaK/EbsC family protein [Acidimicrobiales bacterium]|nr:YbaK/EbsC family protein [Acidimicrobiales bacterium]